MGNRFADAGNYGNSMSGPGRGLHGARATATKANPGMTRPNLLIAVRRRPLRVLLWVAVVFVIGFLASVAATVWAAALVFAAAMAAWRFIGRDRADRHSEQQGAAGDPD